MINVIKYHSYTDRNKYSLDETKISISAENVSMHDPLDKLMLVSCCALKNEGFFQNICFGFNQLAFFPFQSLVLVGYLASHFELMFKCRFRNVI